MKINLTYLFIIYSILSYIFQIKADKFLNTTNQNSSQINNNNNLSTNNSELCEHDTDELLKFLTNSSNSTKTFNDFQGFILYSGININDYGDYSNCINDKKSNYILVKFFQNILLSGKFGLCYFKSCNSDYINSSKNKLIQIINAQLHINLTEAQINFSNPREKNLEYRSTKYTGLIICIIILSLIASISIIKLFINEKIEIPYDQLIDTSMVNNSKENLLNQKNMKNTKKTGTFMIFLNYFDILKNSRSIYKINNPNKTFEYLRVFDGVRVLSTCWVVWGHFFLISVSYIKVLNNYDIYDKFLTFKFSILTNAFLSVDVFFYLSGFLLYFNLQKYLKQAKNKIGFFFISLFQRYIRLLPFNLLGLFVMTYTVPFLIDGAKSEFIPGFFRACENKWWPNLLYIQNLVDYSSVGGSACVGHGWYLCDDMIYFIASTIIILFIYNKKIIKNVLFIFIFIFSCVWSVIRSIDNNYTLITKNKQQQKGDYFKDFYIQPIARLTPYLLGILYCELFFETDVYKSSLKKSETSQEENPNFLRKINVFLKNNDLLCMILFIFSFLLVNFGLFVIYIVQNYEISRGFDVFLITFDKIIFIIGLGNILHLIFLEKLEFIRIFLSLNVFTRLSRVTYGVYMLHYYVVMIFLFNSDTSFRMDFIEYSFYVMGTLFITFFISFVSSILFESPIVNMLKVFKNNEKADNNSPNKIDDSKKNTNFVKV